MGWKYFLPQLLIANCAFAITQTCVFKSGVAKGYVACDPTASQGTCCSQGEACLGSGLCYGSLGIVYRGACINEWSSSGCVTYCDDKSANWANLYPCTDGTGSSAPAYWWCGNDTDVTCSRTSGTVLDIVPEDAIKLLTAAPSSTTAVSISTSSSATTSPTLDTAQIPTSTGSSTGSPTGFLTTSSTASSPKSCAQSSDKKATVTGGVIGGTLGALSAVMIIMFLKERRRRKEVEKELAERPVTLPDHYADEMKLTAPYYSLQQAPQELGPGDRLNELGPNH